MRANQNRLVMCTPNPLTALTHLRALTEKGHGPNLTDLSGKPVTAADLQKRVDLAQSQVSPPELS